MTLEEFQKQDALSLAALIRQKEITASEVTELAIQRAEAVNPTINAIIHPLYDMAREMARQSSADSPFAGQPFLVKDLGLDIKGVPRRTGCRGYSDYVGQEDSFLIEQYRKAGLSFLGKTNTPEFGYAPFTEPELFGPTRNPWNPDYSPGGSSGGSGAAVAAGITPLATASDGGGSIRIPASSCGLFGLKPSRGLLSMGPAHGEMWQGAIAEGCISRSVRDTAAFLDASKADSVGEVYPPLKSPSFTEAIQQAPRRLRIAFNYEHTLGLQVDEDCKKATEHAAKLLESLGHRVEKVSLPYYREDLAEVFLTMVVGEAGADVQELEQHLGRPIRQGDLEPPTHALGLLGSAFNASDFAYQKRKWNAIGRRIGQFHQQYDLILTPTAAMAPFKIGTLQPSAAELQMMKIATRLKLRGALKSRIEDLAIKIFTFIPFTPFANITGQPSMSVPLYWNEKGLPVGSMLTAPIGQDALLLQLAAELEVAQPWFDKRPNI